MDSLMRNPCGESRLNKSKMDGSPPGAPNASGRPDGWQSSRYNIAFCFGVQQDTKMSACDDLKHFLTNR